MIAGGALYAPADAGYGKSQGGDLISSVFRTGTRRCIRGANIVASRNEPGQLPTERGRSALGKRDGEIMHGAL